MLRFLISGDDCKLKDGLDSTGINSNGDTLVLLIKSCMIEFRFSKLRKLLRNLRYQLNIRSFTELMHQKNVHSLNSSA